MSYQLETIKFRDLVPVIKIPRFVPNLDVPTIEIMGEDFSSVEAIWINEVQVPEFVILNKSTIWAQLPSGTEAIQTIEVVSSDFTRTAVGSKIDFKLGSSTKKVSGILKLVQLYTKWLLQTPGSDVFNPERGGGLQQVVGRITSSKKMEPVLSVITRAMDQTSTQIRTVQARTPNLPLDERLMSATIMDTVVYEDRMEAAARIRIVSMAGEDAVTPLSL